MSVQDVVQTATQALVGQLAPREAVTILSTQARDALAEARQLRGRDPGRADDYRDLLTTVTEELRAQRADSSEPRMLEAIADELTRVCRALDG